MWRIQPPNVETITINFLSFDTAPHTDYLEVFDFAASPMALLDAYTGDTLPITKTYHTSALLIRFNTNTFTPGMGWELAYSSSATAIEKHDTDKHFEVFPNPASNHFNIFATNQYLQKINIYTIDGRQIYSQKIDKQTTHKVNTKSWSKGIYFIELFSEEIKETKRIIIY